MEPRRVRGVLQGSRGLPREQPKVAKEIHRRTGGAYEATLEECESADDIAFDADWATKGA